MNCFITYQKNNGDIILRPRISDGGLKIGQETSMGWKVLNIHYEYNGNYYTYSDYMRIVHRSIMEQKKLNRKLFQYINRKRQKLINYLIKRLEKKEHNFYYRPF